MESVIDLIRRDPNVSREFRAALRFECHECKVLRCNGHAPRCSRYKAPPDPPYSRDGFVRDSEGRIAGLNGGRYA